MKRAEVIESLIDRDWSSKKKFAENIGIPPTTLQSILTRGVGKASVDNIIKVCKGLGITVERLEELSNQTDADKIMEIFGNHETNIDGQYDYYPIPVAAGLPTSIEGISSDDVQKISIPNAVMGKWANHNDIFTMKVNGDSMNNIFPHGSLIAVKKVEFEQLRTDDIVVFSDEHEYSVKRYYNDVENERIIFSPDSTDRSFTDYSISYQEAKSLKIHGKVVVYIVELD
ncbi:XRE family transcriptional regulator [Sporosarcina sp. 6E9]|uniref:LexA family transcriptional regulator n=1 Tax=Sporosarcina sp. 6E9 TaxID=2819235 RepID=UPI001B307A25|nr:XRE family transcriptional regulator [Sporosarcina sp. 6E9]